MALTHVVGFCDSDWLSLAHAMQHDKSLETLELVGLGIGTEMIHVIAKSLAYNTIITTLDLCENLRITAYQPFIDTIESLICPQDICISSPARILFRCLLCIVIDAKVKEQMDLIEG